MNYKELRTFAKDNNALIVDLKFIDFIGTWQHLAIPISELSEDIVNKGIGFDGSSLRMWQPIHISDMLMIPDTKTAVMDPFTKHPTLTLICDILDPITKKPYSRDPRHIASKAEAYLKKSGIADTCYFGPEAEFFVFDDVRFEQGINHGFYELDSNEGSWNTGRDEEPNLAYKPRQKQGYFPVLPTDSLHDLRSEMALVMQSVGLTVEALHHEVGGGGQCEIDIRFDSLKKTADNLMWFKYIVKNVAHRNGKTATFMPKPIYGDNGSGMHCHQSLWKDKQPLFAGNKYANLSDMAMYYLGGVIKHANSICAFTNPTTNSYKRLVPGFEAPVNMVYSERNRSAAIRIPTVDSPKGKRLELRFPDPSCNPYLAFSAMMMAGLDGIKNKIDPGDPLEQDIYELPAKKLAKIPSAPVSLNDALNALKKDHKFLLEGDVFTKDVIDMWINYKYEKEISQLSGYPTPMEFDFYFDI